MRSAIHASGSFAFSAIRWSPSFATAGKAVVDTECTTPEQHALLAVYVDGRGAFLGRWDREGDVVLLRRSDPDAPPVVLSRTDQWTVWGTVTTIVQTASHTE